MEPQTQYRETNQFAQPDVSQRSSLGQQAFFRKEGEYWSLGYREKSFRLKDTKGLGYLAHLLRHPGTEFHVLDLAGRIAGQSDDDEQGLPRGGEDLEQA